MSTKSRLLYQFSLNPFYTTSADVLRVSIPQIANGIIWLRQRLSHVQVLCPLRARAYELSGQLPSAYCLPKSKLEFHENLVG